MSAGDYGNSWSLLHAAGQRAVEDILEITRKTAAKACARSMLNSARANPEARSQAVNNLLYAYVRTTPSIRNSTIVRTYFTNLNGSVENNTHSVP